MNTIKTKIGFDTKPYTLKTIHFYELLNVSAKAFGQILLSLSIILSIACWTHLRQIEYRQANRLELLKYEGMQFEKQYNALIKEHTNLTAPERLDVISTELNMHQASPQESIYIPKNKS